MTFLIHSLARGLLLAVSMFWTVLWALVLGFTRSAVVRVLLSREQAERSFGGDGPREVALAALWGAGSFATSYAAVATARTLFRKHGSLLCALVFLFASTNLSAEFVLVLWLLMGWRVVLLEVTGGLVFIAALWLFVRLTWPAEWAREAHARQEDEGDRLGQHRVAEAEGNTLREKLASRRNWAAVADGFVSNWRATWWQLALGFVLAGCLAASVPPRWWQALQAGRSLPAVRVAGDALLGAAVAVASCVTSVGNLPLARLLHAEGLSLSGVVSFLFADLLALPLLLVYRASFGLRTAAYIAAALSVSAVAAGVAADVIARAVRLAPRVTAPPGLILETHGGWRYPTLMNVAALLVAGALVAVRARYGRPQTSGDQGSEG